MRKTITIKHGCNYCTKWFDAANDISGPYWPDFQKEFEKHTRWWMYLCPGFSKLIIKLSGAAHGLVAKHRCGHGHAGENILDTKF